MMRFTKTLLPLLFLLLCPALLCIQIAAPIYFEELPQSRIEEESAFFTKHSRWSQRVIIEMIAHGILGTAPDQTTMRDDSSVGMFRHPKTGLFEHFNTTHSLGWKHNELDYISDKASICTLRGITCGGVEYTKPNRRDWNIYHADRETQIAPAADSWSCWCVSRHDVQVYTWAEDSDSQDERCIQDCLNRGGGHVPKKSIPLDAIVAIDLAGWGLVGAMIPFAVSGLSFLESIDISKNRFIGQLKLNTPNLKHLLVSDNDVLSLSFENMWSLDLLDLRNTGIGGTLPENLLNVMPNLSYLDLGENAFVGTIPLDIFGNMPKLQTLDLGNNQLTGSIPNQLIRLPLLERLLLGTNQFTSFPHDDWPSSKQFKEIVLNDNQLTGSIPPEMFQSSLEHLELSMNKLKGPIPKEIEGSRNLRYLDLANNRITGTVPLEIYNLPRLKSMRLYDNRLQGQVLDSICKISSVIIYRSNAMPKCTNMAICPRGYFHPEGHATPDEDCAACPPCHSNDLKNKSCLFIGQTTCEDGSLVINGDFDGDGQLSEREILRFMFLKMNGDKWKDKYIPWMNINKHPDACALSGITCRDGLVTEIRLQNVGLGPGKKGEGLLPQIGLLRNLVALDLSENDIRSIPAEIGQLKSLRHLFCRECGLHSFQPAIWTLDTLEALFLSMNDFRNLSIPPDIAGLKKLTDLKLHRCELVGSIPSELSLLTNLQNLDLYGNNLTGALPETMKDLVDIYRIDIYNNQLHGSILPLANLPNLQILHAKHNHFSGTIPSFISLKLTWLDLSENMFVGAVPHTLGQMSKLAELHLGNNKLFSVPSSLCSLDSVNGGSTGNCDHILCPIGTSSAYGYARQEFICEPCPEGKSTMFLGSTVCSTHTVAEYVDLFSSLVNGVAPSMGSEEYYDECDLEGVECDEEYQLKSIEFSLSNLEFDKNLFTGIL